MEIFNTIFAWIFNRIPYSDAKKWLEIYSVPEKIIETEDGTISSAIKSLIISAIPYTIFLVLLSTIVDPGKIIVYALYPVVVIVLTTLYVGATWLTAKIMRGTGSFQKQFYLMSLVQSGEFIMLVPLVILVTVPFIGLIFSLAGAMLLIYIAYLHFKIIKTVHKISTIKAILVAIPPLFLLLLYLSLFGKI